MRKAPCAHPLAVFCALTTGWRQSCIYGLLKILEGVINSTRHRILALGERQETFVRLAVLIVNDACQESVLPSTTRSEFVHL